MVYFNEFHLRRVPHVLAGCPISRFFCEKWDFFRLNLPENPTGETPKIRAALGPENAHF
jgi:hypothetical protein